MKKQKLIIKAVEVEKDKVLLKGSIHCNTDMLFNVLVQVIKDGLQSIPANERKEVLKTIIEDIKDGN